MAQHDEEITSVLQNLYGLCGAINPSGTAACHLAVNHDPAKGHGWQAVPAKAIDDATSHLDRITALLALPRDACLKDIALAVQMCVRRCEQLEAELAQRG